MNRLAICALSILFAASSPTVADGQPTGVGNRPQLRHLPAVGKSGRFALLGDRVWPERPGEAHVCLWEDDAFAAASITIDDNCAPEHEWWIEQGERTGFRFTWFIITKSLDAEKPGFSGCWEDFRKLKKLGHDVQSHTVSHSSKDNERPDDVVEAEYRDSQAAIERNVGGPVVCMAYPWGRGKPALADTYYVACRGTVGIPNVANTINYMSTGTANIHPNTVDMLLTGKHATTKWMNRAAYKRAWVVPLYHSVRHGRTPEERAASLANVKAQIDYLYTKRDEIWVGLFRDVAFYGMERDTADLQVTENTDSRLQFTLQDDMDDRLFTYPLTVKVRLPDGWSNVQARQADTDLPARIVEHDGHRYALVKAVPDTGTVTLIPAP
jgi:peptidoglycan/xylan/chitin deacetylase (PgdA/CDA1 family)